jgi:hypothetical protein
MSKLIKECVFHNLPFHILSGIAILLLIVSFLLPPQGQIDPSVLQAVAEIFAFSALYTVVIAIDKGATAKIKHKETELEISKKEEE